MGSPNDGSRSDDVPTAQPPDAAPATSGRRRTLELLVATGGAVYACSLLVPAARFLATASATADDRGRWLRVAKLDALKEGQPTRIQLRGEQRDAFTLTPEVTLGSVWLMRQGNELRALSAECPHLGCAVDVTADGAKFGCPCHTSRFALDGRAESGPSPRGMDPLSTRVVDGFIEVEFRRFRQGSSERVEVTT